MTFTKNISDMLCTVMLPTRRRPNEALRCIDSLFSSATSPDWECIVWIDDDDMEMLALKPSLESRGVRVYVGPKLGYSLLDRGYYTLIAYHALGRWVWIMNDDMVVSGDWMGKLASAPTHQTFCQPEIHGLGGSRYHNDNRTGCPLFLNGCWKEAGWHTVPEKADYNLTDKLERLGWHCHFLAGVMVWHDRGNNAEYDAHHAK